MSAQPTYKVSGTKIGFGTDNFAVIKYVKEHPKTKISRFDEDGKFESEQTWHMVEYKESDLPKHTKVVFHLERNGVMRDPIEHDILSEYLV